MLRAILSGSANVSFGDFVHLVEGYGFQLKRVRGSHHIFERADIPQLLNLQSDAGQAKRYQITQFLKLVERYNLNLEDDA